MLLKEKKKYKAEPFFCRHAKTGRGDSTNGADEPKLKLRLSLPF